jgi:hypothetical protein
MPNWYLFVDETGKFPFAESPVSLAGALVPETSPLCAHNWLQTELQKVQPGIPWPIHTAHLNVPVIFALAHRAGQVRGGAPPWPAGDFTPVAERVLGFLDGRGEPTRRQLGRAVADLAATRYPPYNTLQELDQQVRRNDDAGYGRLRDHARHAVAQLARFISEHPSLADIVMVFTSEGSLGDGFPPGSPDIDYSTADEATKLRKGTPRYLALLGALIERTGDLLGRKDRHEVFLRIASLPAYDETTGTVGLLRQRHLAAVLEQLAGRVPANAHFNTAEPLAYGVHPHGALVVADFVLNRVRHFLHFLQKPYHLPELERDIMAEAVGPRQRIRSGDPALSHIAATGWPRAAVSAACAGSAAPPARPRIKAWALEQAQEWVHHLREGRRS